jgi:hypothetical protein
MTTGSQQSHHDAGGPSLTAAEYARLIAVLGMLGSEHAGERAAAGLHASRLLRERGLGWGDVIVAATVGGTDTWRQQAKEAAQFAGLLTPWERDFLRKLMGFPTISGKQHGVPQQIIAKVHGA